MTRRRLPELLAPAGSLEAARAAIANGADAVYLGAERFNARDEGAQLTLEEVEEACRLAHGRGARVYLTLNTLVKPLELADALLLLGDAIDRGVDPAIVQDVGLMRLIQQLYPGFEIHASTQTTVHDASGAAVMRELGVRRVVLARENTLEDIQAIRFAVPELELETFIHGALCISYSGQCYMSGMISERSANRGSCAQSCRKEYILTDDARGVTLDRGYLISARDLAAAEHLEALAEAGVHTLKIEGRKKKPEYVATVTRSYREFLARIDRGEPVTPDAGAARDLVQIYSRGFTGGMYGGRAGREYVTRDHPDHRGLHLGVVVADGAGEIVVESTEPIDPGDGLAFEPPPGLTGERTGFVATAVRTLRGDHDRVRQAIASRIRIPVGWRVMRTARPELVERARASYASVASGGRARKTRLDVAASGTAGAPLALVFTASGHTVALRSDPVLVPARERALDHARLREQLGRLGETAFALGSVDGGGLAPGLFLPVSELNHLRQRAVEELTLLHAQMRDAAREERRARIVSCLSRPAAPPVSADAASRAFTLAADVCRVDDGRAAAEAGATEVSIDPFLRHPVPPRSHIRALADELGARGVAVRLRTPTIVRPAERAALDAWLALELPILSGHLGLIAELSRAGRDVVADYAVNCFNAHTAAEYFRLGARRVTLAIELTGDEMAQVARLFHSDRLDVLVYGRPEGMTIEHCVLSAAFDREPTTCRDLCVQKHPSVSVTDPAGYVFPVATDAACRNRLLHSRPIEASEYLPTLWNAGLRGFRLLFNVPGDPVGQLVRAYRDSLDALAAELPAPVARPRALVGSAFTRGHFAHAV